MPKASDRIKSVDKGLVEFAVGKYGEPHDVLDSASGSFLGLPDLKTDPGARVLLAGVKASIKEIKASPKLSGKANSN